MRTVLTRIRLGGCPGLSEYSLGAQVILLDLPCSTHSSFTVERNVQVKYIRNIFHTAKYLNFSDDFRHILSYKRAMCVAIKLKWLNSYPYTRKKNENYQFLE